MTKPVKFAHVVYQTRRYDEMISWYAKVFEAEVVHQDPALAFMTYDDEHHRFAFANLDVLNPAGQASDQRGAIGVNHVAYTFASAGDLMANYARLKAAGVTPYWPIHHGPMKPPIGSGSMFVMTKFQKNSEMKVPAPRTGRSQRAERGRVQRDCLAAPASTAASRVSLARWAYRWVD